MIQNLLKNIIFLSIIFIGLLQANIQVKLTLKEKNFLKEHPVITLGTGDSWAPYIMKDNNGNNIGYDNDILTAINKATGANFIQILGNWSKMQEMAKAKKIDGLSTLSVYEERKQWFNFSNTYISLQKFVMVRARNPRHIKSNEDLEGKIVVINKGNMVDEKTASKFKNSKIIYADTVKEMLEDVVYGKADATFGNGATSYLLNKLGLPYLDFAYPLNDSLKLSFAVRKDWPEAISILNKGLATISNFRRTKFKQKWFGGTFNLKNNALLLTRNQENYLKNKKQIKMCIDPDIMPFEKLKNGKHIGIAADFFKIFQKDINIPIKIIKTNSWAQSLEFVKKRKCDILSLAMKTPNRGKYLNFTTPYFESSLVLVTKPNVHFIDNIGQLINKKIGIVKGYATYEILHKQYPKLNIITTNNVREGLQKVANGELFGFIENIASISYLVQEKFLGEIKISSKLDKKLELGVAIRSDDTELLNIFNAIISKLTLQDKQNIINKYLSIKYEKGFDYKFFWQIFIVFSIIILVLLSRYYSLAKLNKKIEKLSVTDSLTQISNRLNLDNNFKNEFERAKRYKSKFSIILIDIDFFKNVNDTYGHKVGDNILIKITQLLKENIRNIDILGRWGGEEFLIISPETNINQAKNLANKMRLKIEKYDFPKVSKLTCSFGVTTYNETDNFEDMFMRADKALYKAKNNGRNIVIAI